MRRLVALVLVLVVLACGQAAAPVDPCAGQPRTDYGEVWSRPRPMADGSGTMWNVTFLLPPCSWRTVRDTVLRCAAPPCWPTRPAPEVTRHA